MFITLMKSKIHRATVTEANLDYVGSITIDEEGILCFLPELPSIFQFFFPLSCQEVP